MTCDVCGQPIYADEAYSRRLQLRPDGEPRYGCFKVMHLETCAPPDLLQGLPGRPREQEVAS